MEDHRYHGANLAYVGMYPVNCKLIFFPSKLLALGVFPIEVGTDFRLQP